MGKKKKKEVKIDPVGTIRIKVKDLAPYEKTKKSWKKSSKSFPRAMYVIDLFRAHDNFKELIDKKNPEFIKGAISPEDKVRGARINILPNGKKLDKAFSLFGKELTIHDESSNRHWDVIYQNPGGTFSYLYTLEKKNRLINKKYRAVQEFAKRYPTLKRNVCFALKKEDDCLAVPMYTLLKTYMRVGNEIYYKLHHHKGLTTLKKEDVSIRGNCVLFNYIAKDGVPTTTQSTFPDSYITRLRKILNSTKRGSFIFVNGDTGHPLTDVRFKDAFKRYCGKEFYPHIVRSHYATIEAENFISKNKSPTKEDVHNFFLSLAEKLGHKRFIKNDGVWKENYNVTVRHYIRPELVKKIKESVAKNGK